MCMSVYECVLNECMLNVCTEPGKCVSLGDDVEREVCSRARYDKKLLTRERIDEKFCVRDEPRQINTVSSVR